MTSVAAGHLSLQKSLAVLFLSDFVRSDWLRTGAFRASSCRPLCLIPLHYRHLPAWQSSRSSFNSVAILGREAEERPDMFSVFAGKVKQQSEVSAKELENDEANAERLKKEQEQKSLDEAVAEKLKKEKEIEEKVGPPPDKPLPGDCCGNGCTPCVWDTYWEELADYKKRRESLEDS
ncbi:hypothetical protein R1flu_012666 [Riccia fluitans]|uniref:Oxidoreductase-like domain-containing protein n=1 Tax=Riccia fluitans TaxID=41844 RepID=A0ABD1ZDR6_9MARC